MFRVAYRFGVKPTDEELEGEVIGIRKAKCLGTGAGVGGFVVEACTEEGGVVAEELFVEDPVSVFRANVNVNKGVGEESGGGVSTSEGWGS